MSVDATAVLVKYTYGGDANLDGFVSGDDYSSIDFNIAVPNAFGWYNGDFNYDGIISGDDYSVIDFNIVAQGPPLTSSSAAATSAFAVARRPTSKQAAATVSVPFAAQPESAWTGAVEEDEELTVVRD